MNAGVAETDSDHILVLNSDCFLALHALHALDPRWPPPPSPSAARGC